VPIEYQGEATGTNTATLPAHQAGDLILCFAYRDGNNTAPTVPGGVGWSTVGSAAGGNTNSSVLVRKVAAGSSETVGTFTNATSVVCLVYRGVNQSSPVGGQADTGAQSSTITYPALTMTVTDDTSWVAGFAGHRSANVTIETAPSGMTNRTSVSDATDEAAGHDTNGGVSSWSAQTSSVNGTSSGWRARTVEIVADVNSATITVAEGADVVSATATTILSASLDVTASSDVVAMEGESFSLSDSEATITVVESSDTVSATATTITTASLSVAGGNDTVSATATTITSASIAVSAASDTVSMTGTQQTSASISVVGASDTVSIAGTTITPASLAIQSSNDTVSATATTITPASISVTAQSDIVAIEGSTLGGNNDALISVTDSPDSVSLAGTTITASSIQAVESSDIVAGESTSLTVGLLTITESSDGIFMVGDSGTMPEPESFPPTSLSFAVSAPLIQLTGMVPIPISLSTSAPTAFRGMVRRSLTLSGRR